MKKGKIKTLGQLKKELDRIFSKWVRLKDNKDGKVICVTCKRWMTCKESQAGHFVSRVYLSTRFDEENVHVQCSNCNIWRRGNLDEYALYLIKKYGQGILERLSKKKHSGKKYSRLEYTSFIQIYKDKVKKLLDDGKKWE